MTTRAALEARLTYATSLARKGPCTVGTEDRPSEWDRWHELLDELLDAWRASG